MAEDVDQKPRVIGTTGAVGITIPSSQSFFVGDTLSSRRLVYGEGNVLTLDSRDHDNLYEPFHGFQDGRIAALSRDLDAVRNQIASIQKEAPANAAVAEQVQTLTSLVEQAQAKSKELMAPVLLPPMEDMEVRLVASHSLERLEEYRSDENKYYLFIGLFGGAILGILANWFTSAQFTITRFSVIFIALLAILTLACVFMVMGISKRAKGLRTKMLSNEARPTTSARESQETD